MKEFKVCESNSTRINKLKKQRADWGHKKYGDRDKLRDTCLDILEEILDIKNITDRRLKHINEEHNKIDTETLEFAYKINLRCDNLIKINQEFDEHLRKKYGVTDENGGFRVGISE
jgi:hypothetical protein